MSDRQPPYVPQERQKLFHTTLANEILYGGQAGGGKSYCLRWDLVDICLSLPGAFCGLFRQTLPMLEENHIVFIRDEIEILSDFYRQKIGNYNETRKKVEFINGSVLRFRHLEYDKDCADIQGWELQAAGVDEAAQMSPYRLGYIKSRIRMGNKAERWAELCKSEPWRKEYLDRVPRYALTSNPGGEGHHWLKENFIDPAPPETIFENRIPRKRGPDIIKTRIFIPATMYDNRYLDEDYEAQFSDLPEFQQKQLRDGDWNVIPGAFFDCWNEKNIIRPFQVPDHWTRIVSCDWGFAKPYWVGEFVVSDGKPVKGLDGEEITFPEGCLILKRESYGRSKNNEGVRRSAHDVGIEIKAWGEPEIAVLDESAWNKHDYGHSPAERFAQAGVYFSRADRDRILGWQEMYSRIKDGMLLSVDTCHHFIRTIATLESDDTKPEDIKKKGEDHAGDGCRYACMARPYKKDRPTKKKPWFEAMLEPPTFNQAIEEAGIRNRNTEPDVI